MTPAFRQCTRCVMTSDADSIVFDEMGRCNYCTDMISKLQKADHTINPADLARRLESFIARVKADGEGKQYDCIVGVSGGADSSYALYLAKQHGLRPLAVHMDNGWNSELAVNNIENLVRRLGVDLYTHVVDWREYRELQQAFFDADVIDIELLYDNAMLAVNYRLAREYGLKYILSGSNTSTEGMRVPKNYNWNKYDRTNILAIAGTRGAAVETLPTIGVLEYIWSRSVLKIGWVPFLDFIDYNKQRCIDTLATELKYRTYPYKHYESIFTRFYQGHLLPQKFGIDKRRLHLSSLICSGQMTRDEAEKHLNHSPYPDQDDLEADIDYFLKKMNWTSAKLHTYLNRPPRPHTAFASEAWLYDLIRQIQLKARRR